MTARFNGRGKFFTETAAKMSLKLHLHQKNVPIYYAQNYASIIYQPYTPKS